MFLFKHHKKAEKLKKILSNTELDEISTFVFGKKSVFVEDEEIINQNEKLDEIASKVLSGVPTAYIVERIRINEINLFTPNRTVLIPRVETEELCELAIKEIKKLQIKSLTIIDIGAGSGFIGIYLKKYLQSANIYSIEPDLNAYKVAKRNYDLNNVQVKIINSAIQSFKTSEKFDVIISNPPYIPSTYKSKISKSVKNFEPSTALFARNQGLEIYLEIIKFAKNNLKDNGVILFEVFSKKQSMSIIRYAKKHFKLAYTLHKDSFGKWRFCKIILNR